MTPTTILQTTDGRKMRGERSRARVLKHAGLVASTEGLDGLTFGRLADDLGMSKANLAALQLATLDAAMECFITRAVAPALRKRSALARLRALCDCWFDFVGSRTYPGGCFMYGTANEFAARPGPLRDRVMERFAQWRNLLASNAREAIDCGELPRDEHPGDLVCRLLALQQGANLAILLDDDASFARARTLTARHCSRFAQPRSAKPARAFGRSRLDGPRVRGCSSASDSKPIRS